MLQRQSPTRRQRHDSMAKYTNEWGRCVKRQPTYVSVVATLSVVGSVPFKLLRFMLRAMTAGSSK